MRENWSQNNVEVAVRRPEVGIDHETLGCLGRGPDTVAWDSEACMGRLLLLLLLEQGAAMAVMVRVVGWGWWWVGGNGGGCGGGDGGGEDVRQDFFVIFL